MRNLKLSRKRRIGKTFNPVGKTKIRGEALPGIFGTHAVLTTDINLLIQIIAFLLLLTGLIYKAKGKFRIHGSVMGVAVFMHLISFLLAMGPSLFINFEFFTTDTAYTGVKTLWVHAITGAVALILGIVLVVAWIFQSSNVKACVRRKRLMDVTALLWTISVIFGVATYLLFYL
jgi:uncharacterized membrane protein YozB (DUF420 family)